MKTKAHVIINEDILNEIDRVAGRRKRSFFIEQATREKLERGKFLKALEETTGAWSDKRHPELKTSKDLEQYVKEKRQAYQKRLRRIVNE